uniref:SHSP domain-containing protein n=1 Tax=Kalanchoe fedtschenkoi TaxID=63787 RepID=A0A7N0U8X7_KALFE
MALARLLALRNLQSKLSPSALSASRAAAAARDCPGLRSGSVVRDDQAHSFSITRGFAANAASAASTDSAAASKEIATDQGIKKPLGKRRRRKSWSPWNALFQPRRDIMEMFPSGLGYALLNATQNINKLLESINISPPPSRGLPTWKLREQDQAYTLRFQVPGLAKEDLKITVEDGVLHITGERREEEEEAGEEDEFWSAKVYGFYDTSLVLPEDAKVEEIKAELKNGVLNVVIPRAPEKPRKEDVKEIQVAG